MFRGRHKYKREKSKLYGVGKYLKLTRSGCNINLCHVKASNHPSHWCRHIMIFPNFQNPLFACKYGGGERAPYWISWQGVVSGVEDFIGPPFALDLCISNRI